jgi:hypothetical protein
MSLASVEAGSLALHVAKVQHCAADGRTHNFAMHP